MTRAWLLAIGFLLLAAPASAGMPTYVTSGTFTAASGTCTPNMPSVSASDVLLAVGESENETISLSTANGFAEVTGSPQGAGTAATNPANRIAVYWKRAVGGDAAPVFADSGNHTTCRIHVFAGVKTSGNPWNITAGGTDGGLNDQSAVIPGATTTVDNALVALIQGTSNNATSTTNCGAVTNADLASLTERTDNTNTINAGGGHCLITGQKALKGAYAASTLTLSVTTFKGAMSIALEGAPDPEGGAGGAYVQDDDQE